jgi:hypothetical protein
MRPDQILGDRYRLVERIGTGGMGEVWRATDPRLGRDVAIKCLYDRGDERDIERARRHLLREAEIAAGLRNPHIVAVFDIVTDDDLTCLVMEHVPSRDLRDIIRTDGPLAPARAAEIGAQIADALRATHEAGIVHGDVKPANVLIDENDKAKITDFGIARRMSPGGTMTDVGLVRGTPGYIAPEVASGDEVTPASDMFGLGATLFAATEGVSPYGEGDASLLIRRAQNYGTRGFELLPCRAAGPLTPLVQRLLARAPGRRPTALTAHQVLTDRVELPPDPLPARLGDVLRGQWRAVVRHRLAAGVSAIALAALVAAVVVLPGGQGSARGDSSAPGAAVPAQIADPRTVDPCALTDAKALGRYGAAQTNANYGAFDRCDVIVQTSNGATVDVEAQFQNPGDSLPGGPSASPTKTGAVEVVRPPGQSGECDRSILLTGGYAVVVSASLDSGNGPVGLCAMADTATGSAVSALDRGKVPRRATPASSLVSVDACQLLDASALVAVPGTIASQHQAGFGNWSCQWDSVANGMSVSLRFDQNNPLGASDGTLEQLGGRQAFVTPGGDGGNDCLVQVVYRTFVDANGDPTEELLYLVVTGSQPQTQLCQPATRLAAAASTKLTKG